MAIDPRRTAVFPTFRFSPCAAAPAAAAARRRLEDPVSRFCLVVPLLRRELDQVRGRLGTVAERRDDRRQLAATSRRLAELLRVTFA